jgi:hypothetical protein
MAFLSFLAAIIFFLFCSEQGCVMDFGLRNLALCSSIRGRPFYAERIFYFFSSEQGLFKPFLLPFIL